MRKTLFTLLIAGIVVLGCSSYSRYTSGIAGYTASPGEPSCNFCHNGGSVPSTFGSTITSVPGFSNNQYVPGLTYTMSIIINSEGYSKFGFAAEALKSDHTNAGVLQPLATDVQTLVAGNRINITHTGGKNGMDGTTFSFLWTAPMHGTGSITYYLAANSVNGNHSISGDFALPPITLILNEGGAIPTFIKENELFGTPKVLIYPNPATKTHFNIVYTLNKTQRVRIELTSLEGKHIKMLLDELQDKGSQLRKLELQEIPEGIYLVRTILGEKTISNKMIIVGKEH